MTKKWSQKEDTRNKENPQLSNSELMSVALFPNMVKPDREY